MDGAGAPSRCKAEEVGLVAITGYDASAPISGAALSLACGLERLAAQQPDEPGAEAVELVRVNASG
jgi:hypothetical protein